MPILKVGKKFKYGKKGKLYTSRSAAAKQGKAIEASKHRKKKK